MPLRDHGDGHTASRSTRQYIYLDAFVWQLVRICPQVMLGKRIQHFIHDTGLIAP